MNAQRVLGEKLSISIGTAIPLEEKLMVEQLPIQELWINVRTLFRNLHDAYAAPHLVDPGVMVHEYLEEIQVIRGLVGGVVTLVLYSTDNDPRSLMKLLPYAKIKVPKTDKQKAYASLEATAVRAVLRDKEIPIVEAKQILKGKNAKAWVMTHQPIDLVSQYEFSRLSLLNSHTGDIKTPLQWMAKLTNNEKYMHLPFNLLTLQMFGDKAQMFLAQPPTIKAPLLEVAIKNRWGPTTTRDKILSNLKQMRDPALAEIYRIMLTAKLK